MRNRRLASACLLLSVAAAILPAVAKDLPFAPPRKKPTNPIVFMPAQNEAITAKLDLGWQLADQINEPKKLIVMKFIPPEYTSEYSPKMINFAMYLDKEFKKQTAREFMQEAKENSQKMAPKGALTWNVVSNDQENDCIFELTLKGWHDAPDQYEMERVVKGKDGIHAVIYHLDKPDITEPERQQILSWLKTVKVVSREDFVGSTKGGAAAVLPSAVTK